jgi:hypothetical protein
MSHVTAGDLQQLEVEESIYASIREQTECFVVAYYKLPQFKSTFSQW